MIMKPFTPTNDPAYLELLADNGERITGYRFNPDAYHPYCHPVNLPGERGFAVSLERNFG